MGSGETHCDLRDKGLTSSKPWGPKTLMGAAELTKSQSTAAISSCSAISTAIKCSSHKA